MGGDGRWFAWSKGRKLTPPANIPPPAAVLTQLKEKKLKGGADDSAVVVRYADSIYKPMQERLVALAPQIKLPAEGEGAEEKQKRLETLPFLLKGHLLELAAACRSGDAKEQLQEMEVRALAGRWFCRSSIM